MENPAFNPTFSFYFKVTVYHQWISNNFENLTHVKPCQKKKTKTKTKANHAPPIFYAGLKKYFFQEQIFKAQKHYIKAPGKSTQENFHATHFHSCSDF